MCNMGIEWSLKVDASLRGANPLKYHPLMFDVLTLAPYRGCGQCLVGSLTGAVSSQSVTEEHEG